MKNLKLENIEKLDTRTSSEKNFEVFFDKDVVKIREYARDVAYEIGFSNNERTLIATAVSEISRNILEYAKKGEISIECVMQNSQKGIVIVASDNGPGIADISLALKDGYSSGRGMGVGLPGTKRIMDEFKIDSQLGLGTKIIMRKWVKE